MLVKGRPSLRRAHGVAQGRIDVLVLWLRVEDQSLHHRLINHTVAGGQAVDSDPGCRLGLTCQGGRIQPTNVTNCRLSEFTVAAILHSPVWPTIWRPAKPVQLSHKMGSIPHIASVPPLSESKFESVPDSGVPP